MKVAIIGAAESGIGAALLAKKKKYDVFVSDFGEIPEKYKEELKNNNWSARYCARPPQSKKGGPESYFRD